MDSKTNPLISVVMSTFNRADTWLPRAIASVFSQTVEDFELIIVDDNSTDNTFDVVRSFSDKRVKYISLDHNSGSDTHPKNVGIAHSTGRYIAYLDDDVEMASYHLEVLLKAFEEDRDLDVAFCESLVYKEGKQIGKAICPCQIFQSPDFNGQFLMNRNYIDTSQVMHKREAVINVGGWDESLPKFVDWNLWVRMMKWGCKFVHVPIPATYYHLHANTKSNRIESEAWIDEELGITMFKPTFSPSGCLIYLPYLERIKQELTRENEKHPKVAIFTITYDRLEYTKRMWDTLNKSTKYPFDWFVYDNGSEDETVKWVKDKAFYLIESVTNKGLTIASNQLVETILGYTNYDIIIKVDNDCEFKTVGWLEDFIDLWKRNHMLYMSPYPEGLVHNPGGGPRIGHSYIGNYYIEVASHVGGLCAFIDAKAYRDFRWSDKFLHGNQDREASEAFKKQRYMPCYIPLHRVMHMDGTESQHKKFPAYFERRKSEKTTQIEVL